VTFIVSHPFYNISSIRRSLALGGIILPSIDVAVGRGIKGVTILRESNAVV
jgi:hypothetical protein